MRSRKLLQTVIKVKNFVTFYNFFPITFFSKIFLHIQNQPQILCFVVPVPKLNCSKKWFAVCIIIAFKKILWQMCREPREKRKIVFQNIGPQAGGT